MTQDPYKGLKGHLNRSRTCYVHESPHLGQKGPKTIPTQDLNETSPSSELDTSNGAKRWCDLGSKELHSSKVVYTSFIILQKHKTHTLKLINA